MKKEIQMFASVLAAVVLAGTAVASTLPERSVLTIIVVNVQKTFVPSVATP